MTQRKKARGDRPYVVLLLCFLFSAAAVCTTAQTEGEEEKEKAVGKKRIKLLIQHLSSSRYSKRKQATEKLIEIGTPALPYLVKHVDSESPEKQQRVRMILEELERETLVYYEKNRNSSSLKGGRALRGVVKKMYRKRVESMLNKYANSDGGSNLTWKFTMPSDWNRSFEGTTFSMSFGFNNRFSMRRVMYRPVKDRNRVEMMHFIVRGNKRSPRRKKKAEHMFHEDPVKSISLKRGYVNVESWRLMRRTVICLLSGKVELVSSGKSLAGAGRVFFHYLLSGEDRKERDWKYSGAYGGRSEFAKHKVAGNMVQSSWDETMLTEVQISDPGQKQLMSFVKRRTNEGAERSWKSLRYLVLTRFCRGNEGAPLEFLAGLLKKKGRVGQKRLAIHCLAELTGKDFRPPGGELDPGRVGKKYLKYLNKRNGKPKEKK